MKLQQLYYTGVDSRQKKEGEMTMKGFQGQLTHVPDEMTR